MKLLQMGTRSRLSPYILVGLILLIPVALYLRSIMTRGEEVLKKSTLEELSQTIKRDPTNARAFYYYGQRQHDLGHIGPAVTALRRASELDLDSKDICLARATIESEAGVSQAAFDTLNGFLQRHPNDADVHWALTLFYVTQDEHRRAYEEAQQVTKLRPNDAKAWRMIGTEALQIDKAGDAETALRKAVALDASDWRSNVLLGDALKRQKHTADAIPFYEKATTLAPQVGMTWAGLGIAQMEGARTPAQVDAAATNLEKAIQLLPNLANAQLALGEARIQQGRWTDAQTSLETAVRLNPIAKEGFYNLVQVFHHQGDKTEEAAANQAFERLLAFERDKNRLLFQISQSSSNPDLILKLARLCAANGDLMEASRQYRRLAGDTRLGPTALKEYRLVQAQRTVSSENPVSVPLSAANTATASTSSASSEGLLRDADQLLKAQKYTEAARAYQSVVEHAPDSFPAQLGLGFALDGLGNMTEAFQAFTNALKIDPKSGEARYGLALEYQKAGFIDEAEHRLVELTKDFPSEPRYWDTLGDCRRKISETGAEEAYTRAVSLAPKEWQYLSKLAEAEGQNHKFDLSETHFRQAIALAPADKVEPDISFAVFLLDRVPTPAHLTEAESLLRKSLSVEPENTRTLLTLGRLLMALHRPREAVPYLEGVIERKPQKEAWYHLARAYDQLGVKDRADYSHKAFQEMTTFENELGDAIERTQSDPDNADLRLKLARLYARHQDHARALNQYEVYLKKRPQDAQIQAEYTQYQARLRATGEMPPMDTFNAMLGGVTTAPHLDPSKTR